MWELPPARNNPGGKEFLAFPPGGRLNPHHHGSPASMERTAQQEDRKRGITAHPGSPGCLKFSQPHLSTLQLYIRENQSALRPGSAACTYPSSLLLGENSEQLAVE